MKSIAYLTLVGGLALACAGPGSAEPVGDTAGDAGASDFFTSPPPPPLGQDVLDYINSLSPDGGDQAVVLVYDTSQYMPKPGAGLNDVQISWTDIAGLTTGAYDQYWMTHASPPLQSQFAPLFFNAPTGNLGESDAAGEGYMFTVTYRRISFFAPVPEPAPLALLAIGIAALLLGRRRMRQA